MIKDILKSELKNLAEAQQAFELEGWVRVESVQKTPYSNSLAYGTLYKKGDKQFFLNINTAIKALQTLKRSV